MKSRFILITSFSNKLSSDYVNLDFNNLIIKTKMIKKKTKYKYEDTTLKGAGIICIIEEHFTNKIICVKNRRSQKWGIPKGHLEKGETLEECAIREFKEETGYNNQYIKINKQTPNFRRINNKYFIVTISLKVLGKSSGVIDLDEIDEFKWFTYEQLQKLDRKEVNSDLWYFIEKKGKYLL